MQLMSAIALASVFVYVGIFLRAKVKFLQSMYVPATILAGLMGMVFINLAVGKININVDQVFYSELVGHLFILSFISIGLTRTKKQKTDENDAERDSVAKTMARGSIGLGLIWCILYGVIAVIGVAVIAVVGKPFDMNPLYGMLIPWGFLEGPGLAVSFGQILEGLGWENAVSVGLTFSAVGFLSAFLFGVPLARFAIKKGFLRNIAKADEVIARGYFKKEEQKEAIGSVTTYSGSLDTLTFHFGLLSVCYVLAVGIARLLAFIPGSIGDTLSGLAFMYGLLLAYLVKLTMKSLNIEFFHNDELQAKFTGILSDFLVVCAFMAVQFAVVGKWAIPLLIECIIVVIVTVAVCIFLGQRLGSDYDFERTLGLLGTCTGTVPSGIALLRIVDPRLETPTATEMGLSTWVQLAYIMFPCSIMFAIAAGTMTYTALIGFVAVSTIVMLIIMKVIGTLGKPTYRLRAK